MNKITRILETLLVFIICCYKKIISPLLPAACRFYPTCSNYAIAALKKHGFFKGSWLAFIRVIKCNPLNKGGYDPVP
jgi:uncharacterized protein